MASTTTSLRSLTQFGFFLSFADFLIVFFSKKSAFNFFCKIFAKAWFLETKNFDFCLVSACYLRICVFAQLLDYPSENQNWTVGRPGFDRSVISLLNRTFKILDGCSVGTFQFFLELGFYLFLTKKLLLVKRLFGFTFVNCLKWFYHLYFWLELFYSNPFDSHFSSCSEVFFPFPTQNNNFFFNIKKTQKHFFQSVNLGCSFLFLKKSMLISFKNEIPVGQQNKAANFFGTFFLKKIFQLCQRKKTDFLFKFLDFFLGYFFWIKKIG